MRAARGGNVPIATIMVGAALVAGAGTALGCLPVLLVAAGAAPTRPAG